MNSHRLRFVECVQLYDASSWSEILLLGPMNPCRFDILLEFLDVVSLTRLAESSPNLKSASALLNVYCRWMGRDDRYEGPDGNWLRLLQWLRFTPVSNIRRHQIPQPCPRLDSSWFRRLTLSSQSVLFHHFQSCFDVRMLRAVHLNPRIGIAFHEDEEHCGQFTWYTLELPRHTVQSNSTPNLVWTSWPSIERCMSLWDWPLNASIPNSVKNILLHVGMENLVPVKKKKKKKKDNQNSPPSIELTFSQRPDSFFTLHLGLDVSKFLLSNYGLSSLLSKEVATQYRYVE